MDDPYSYEAAAEQEALHRSLHPKMRSWFEGRQDLKDKFGNYPSFWRDFATWPAFKEVQREYMRWLDRKDAGKDTAPTAPSSVTSTAAVATPAIDGAAAVIPITTAAVGSTETQNVAGRKRRRFETADADQTAAQSQEAPARPQAVVVAAMQQQPAPQPTQQPAVVPKRRSRWSEKDPSDSVRPPPMGLPTARLRTRFGQRLMPAYSTLLPDNATPAQEMVFMYRIRIEELSARLMLLPYEVQRAENDPNRSPSPPAEYDATGKKTNSREQRIKNALLSDRDKWLERIMDLNPTLCGPTGPKFARKIYVPQKDYPDMSFMGRIIGPRGNTQKRLEKETNCKISIRGRGAGRENKRAALAPGSAGEALNKKRMEDDDDDLHVAIIGDRLSEVEAAAKLILDMLKPTDENNEWERLQMVELAAYNGMLLKLNEPCHVCGEQGHKQFECPYREATLKRANVRCAICGDPSHVTSDCKMKRGDGAAEANVDTEYLSFMAELGDEGAKAVVQAKKDSTTATQRPTSHTARPTAPITAPMMDGDAPPGMEHLYRPQASVPVPKPMTSQMPAMAGSGSAPSYSAPLIGGAPPTFQQAFAPLPGMYMPAPAYGGYPGYGFPGAPGYGYPMMGAPTMVAPFAPPMPPQPPLPQAPPMPIPPPLPVAPPLPPMPPP